MTQVLIVGAGLAGLACANWLQRAGVSYTVIEAGDAPGGRVRTDHYKGYLLDRGFQIFLTAYPEAAKLLDYDKLDLRPFYPGALVRYGGDFHKLADPWTNPLDGLKTFLSPVGKPADKLKIASLRHRARTLSLDELEEQDEQTTISALHDCGFSEGMIESFLRPFFSGIFLENDLRTSRRMFDFVFRMLSMGNNTVPAMGMQRIPEQLASALDQNNLLLDTTLKTIKFENQPENKKKFVSAISSDGTEYEAELIILAVEEPAAARLLDLPNNAKSCSTTNLLFTAKNPPVDDPIVVVNGERSSKRVVNNLAVMSNVSPLYAPPGRSLISLSVVGIPDADDEILCRSVLDEMHSWFGSQVRDWEFLRTYRIEYALPDQSPGALSNRNVDLPLGLLRAGDYLANGSINGAMRSGRKAAERAIELFSSQ